MAKKIGIGQMVNGLIEAIERALYSYNYEMGGMFEPKKQFHPTGDSLVWEITVDEQKFRVTFEPIK